MAKQRYIRVAELTSTPQRQGRYPVCPATVWRWVKNGRFPTPKKLSNGVTAWDLDEIEQWERDRAATKLPIRRRVVVQA